MVQLPFVEDCIYMGYFFNPISLPISKHWVQCPDKGLHEREFLMAGSSYKSKRVVIILGVIGFLCTLSKQAQNLSIAA